LRVIAELLLANGRSPDTPAALIRCGTTWQQQVVEGTLATVADLADQARLAPPVVMVIGDVVKLRSKLDWFGRRPLLGQRVVVTQPRDVAGPLSRQLLELGADVLEVPAFRFVPPSDPQALHESLGRLDNFDWVIFSSPQSVSAFVASFFETHHDWREMGRVRLAAYGPQTAEALQVLRLKVDALPAEHLGPAIVAALDEQSPIQGQRILLLRPEGASPKVPQHLQAAGALVRDVTSYRTVVETDDPAGMAERLQAEGAEWITFAGYPDVNYFHRRVDLPQLVARFPAIKLATVGPKTSQLLANLGLKTSAQASTPTVEALLGAIQQAVQHVPHC
jgi:uroporphyrinogen III methyltransferase/synthase